MDVSKNKELTYLSVWSENLTSLDLSKNAALTYLGVYGQLTASALNALFGTLHSNTVQPPPGSTAAKTISTSSNPGAADCVTEA